MTSCASNFQENAGAGEAACLSIYHQTIQSNNDLEIAGTPMETLSDAIRQSPLSVSAKQVCSSGPF